MKLVVAMMVLAVALSLHNLVNLVWAMLIVAVMVLDYLELVIVMVH